MRVYTRTTIADARAIWRHGFNDCDVAGRIGVLFADRPLDVLDGVDGDTVLTLDVPEPTFRRHEWHEGYAYRHAVIPAAVLNHLGRPELYDHDLLVRSRRDLVTVMRRCAKSKRPEAQRHARALRQAIDFFDEVGWLTPLRLQEQRQ